MGRAISPCYLALDAQTRLSPTRGFLRIAPRALVDTEESDVLSGPPCQMASESTDRSR